MPMLCVNMNCFKVYQSPRRRECKCGASVIEVDELYLPVIKMLNQKGYQTNYCCSSHLEKNCPTSYIYFADGTILPYLPEGYEYDDYSDNDEWKNSIVIRRDFTKFNYENELELHLDIVRSAVNVCEWVKSLPELKHNNKFLRYYGEDLFDD